MRVSARYGLFGGSFGQARESATDQADQAALAYNPQGRGLMGNPVLRVLDGLVTGGAFGQIAAQGERARYLQQQVQEQAQQEGAGRKILSAMPTPADYAPASYAPPLGGDGKPLADPAAGIPYAQRYMAWARDAAAQGIDLSKTALPKVSDILPQSYEHDGNLSSFDKLSDTGKEVYRGPVRGTAVGHSILNPYDGSTIGTAPQDDYSLGNTRFSGQNNHPIATGSEFHATSPGSDIYAAPPAAVEAPAGHGPVDLPSAEQLITGLAPGVKFTSGLRTPEHNAEVHGAPNSYHLKGQALDMVPPPGMSMAQLHDAIKASGLPIAELLNERDHVHVALKGDGAAPTHAGIPQKIASGTGPHPATAAERALWKVPDDVPLIIRADGTPDVLSGTGANLKPVPPIVQTRIADSNAALAQIDASIALLQKNPQAMGLMNKLGDTVRQRTDPAGVDTRAAVANIGAMKRHEISGAAVTAAETPNLLPFIPAPTDTPDAAVKKLRLMRAQIERETGELGLQYGPDSGYRPMAAAAPPNAAAPAPRPSYGPKPGPAASAPRLSAPKGPPKAGEIQQGYRFNGGDPANPKNWSKM